MVLTDIPFYIPKRFETRYSHLKDSARPCLTSTDVHEYANFLENEDMNYRCMPNPNNKLGGSKLYSRLHARPSQSLSVSQAVSEIDRRRKRQDRSLNDIEMQLFKEKQNRQDLKRMEFTLVKNQKSLNQMLQGFKQDVDKRKGKEDVQSNIIWDNQLQQHKEYIQFQKRMYKEGLDSSTLAKVASYNLADQLDKKADRSDYLKKLQNTKLYLAKIRELNLYRSEMERLMYQFRDKIETYDGEEQRILQEISEIGSNINAELVRDRMKNNIQKAHSNFIKIQLKEDLMKQNQITEDALKKCTLNKMKYDSEFRSSRNFIDFKRQEEQRNLADVRNKIEGSLYNQKKLDDKLIDYKVSKATGDWSRDIQIHDKRREDLMKFNMQQSKDKNLKLENERCAKAKQRTFESVCSDMENRINDFQKSIERQRMKESDLFKDIKSSSAAHDKQKSLVQLLTSDLAEMKRKNDENSRRAAEESFKNENNLHHQLQHESALLKKTRNEYEEKLSQLNLFRTNLSDEEYKLKTQVKEHDRLKRVGHCQAT